MSKLYEIIVIIKNNALELILKNWKLKIYL